MALPAAPFGRCRATLREMEEPFAELAGYFRRRSKVPDAKLVWLTAAARASGRRLDAIAAGCGVRDYRDITGVVGLPC